MSILLLQMQIKFFPKKIGHLVNYPLFGLIFSVLANLLLQMVVSLLYFNPVDFVLQFEAAKAISRGAVLYRDIDSIIIDNTILPRPQYPPLYLYTLSMLITLIPIENFPWQMVKIFLVIINIITGLLVYQIILNIFKNHSKKYLIALLGLNWFLLNPSTLGIVFGGYHDNFMMMFVLGGFLFFLKQKFKFTGVMFGLALLVKPIAIIYMLPLFMWGIKENFRQIVEIWGFSAVIFLLGALPFLLISPVEFLTDVFLIHTIRPDPSMSIYAYLPLNISTGPVSFLIQGFLISILILYTKISFTAFNKEESLKLVLPLFTLFLITNRILYPHYIPLIFPFFTFNLLFLIFQSTHPRRPRFVSGLILGLGLVYAGYISWSIIWAIDTYASFYSNPYFLYSALLCILGLLIIFLCSLGVIIIEKKELEVII
ncbi:MAG: DUF2029 domain-containing protein [Candidatus Heimdallarchaeota archaeon]|nr:DUF2029 domain-containing protein [Candidatus Heimdallarchaeota archaeon]